MSGYFVVVGELQSENAGVTGRVPQLVSIDLKSGQMRSSGLTGEQAAD